MFDTIFQKKDKYFVFWTNYYSKLSLTSSCS